MISEYCGHCKYSRPALGLAVAASCGWAWHLPIHWLGPLASLVFLIVMASFQGQNGFFNRYLLAASYYLVGSFGIVHGTDIFFGTHGALWEGVFLWIGLSALLSLGWSFANRPWKIVAVLLLDAVPPLGLFDWLSPLSGAGLLFPGGGIGGFLAFLFVVFLCALVIEDYRCPHDYGTIPLIRFLMLLAWMPIVVISNGMWFFHTSEPPQGWVGANLDVGPEVHSLMQDMAHRKAWIRDARAMGRASHAKVVLLPEGLSTWWSGTAFEALQSVSKNQIWLVGVSAPLKLGLMADAIVELHGGKDNSILPSGAVGKMVFASAFPVPVSMWHPWRKGTGYVQSQHVGYKAYWWTPVRKIDGVKAWASICYDQLLPAVWVEGLVQQPQVILLTNNEWWAKGTGIPEIQANTAWSWARLMGVPSVEAENI
ncbi:conjugal transfer protein TraB [Acidithiobacillus sp. MC6.1]|nr:conjugal transfer protein TraB [Acidithiobacillus sp. MC6.1]